jgi:hypothetical protein
MRDRTCVVVMKRRERKIEIVKEFESTISTFYILLPNLNEKKSK